MTMTVEQLAQLREEFEQWAEQVGALPWGILKQHRKQDGSYPGPHYTYMWEAYQAAHVALLDELERKDKRIAELEARTVTVKLPESVIDAICLTAAEIHNLGRGVSDERAQEIINSIRCAAGINLTVEG